MIIFFKYLKKFSFILVLASSYIAKIGHLIKWNGPLTNLSVFTGSNKSIFHIACQIILLFYFQEHNEVLIVNIWDKCSWDSLSFSLISWAVFLIHLCRNVPDYPHGGCTWYAPGLNALWPLLFLILTYSIQDHAQVHDLKCNVYSDDSKIFILSHDISPIFWLTFQCLIITS